MGIDVNDYKTKFEENRGKVENNIKEADIEINSSYDVLLSKVLGRAVTPADYLYPSDKLRSIKESARIEGKKLTGAELKAITDEEKAKTESIKGQIITLIQSKASLISLNESSIADLEKDLEDDKKQVAEKEKENQELTAKNEALIAAKSMELEDNIKSAEQNIKRLEKDVAEIEAYITAIQQTQRDIEENNNKLKQIAELEVKDEKDLKDYEKNQLAKKGKYESKAIDLKQKLSEAATASIIVLGLKGKTVSELRADRDAKSSTIEAETRNIETYNNNKSNVEQFLINEANSEYKANNDAIEANKATIVDYKIGDKEQKLAESKVEHKKIFESLADDIRKYTEGEYARFGITAEDFNPNKSATQQGAPVNNAQQTTTQTAPVNNAQQATTQKAPVNNAQQATTQQGQQGQTTQSAPVAAVASTLPTNANPKTFAKSIKDEMMNMNSDQQVHYLAHERYNKILEAAPNLDNRDKRALKKEIAGKIKGIDSEKLERLNNLIDSTTSGMSQDQPGKEFGLGDIMGNNGKLKTSLSKIDPETLNQVNAYLKYVDDNKASMDPAQIELLESTLIQSLKEGTVINALSRNRIHLLPSARKEDKERKAEISKLSEFLGKNAQSKTDRAVENAKDREKLNPFFENLLNQSYKIGENVMPGKEASQTQAPTQSQTQTTNSSHTR